MGNQRRPAMTIHNAFRPSQTTRLDPDLRPPLRPCANALHAPTSSATTRRCPRFAPLSSPPSPPLRPTPDLLALVFFPVLRPSVSPLSSVFRLHCFSSTPSLHQLLPVPGP